MFWTFAADAETPCNYAALRITSERLWGRTGGHTKVTWSSSAGNLHSVASDGVEGRPMRFSYLPCKTCSRCCVLFFAESSPWPGERLLNGRNCRRLDYCNGVALSALSFRNFCHCPRLSPNPSSRLFASQIQDTPGWLFEACLPIASSICSLLGFWCNFRDFSRRKSHRCRTLADTAWPATLFQCKVPKVGL